MDFWERRIYYLQLFAEHLLLSLGSLLAVTFLGILLGVFVFYSAKSRKIILPLINFLYTIPSIAMFGLLIPLVGIGLKNALIVLIIYGYNANRLQITFKTLKIQDRKIKM